jgi:anthranilate synthase/aminodeoxychorismate synthase-like glutamine amidotransferase
MTGGGAAAGGREHPGRSDMILVIDNYDSFTFNLVQYLGDLGAHPNVIRNDAITVDEIENLAPGQIVISPGPGRPENAGIIIDTIRRFSGRIPILGVCLGHQAIGMAFGGDVVQAPTIMHGKTSAMTAGRFSAVSRIHLRRHAIIPSLWPRKDCPDASRCRRALPTA